MSDATIADGTLPSRAEQAGMSPTTFQATQPDRHRVALTPPADVPDLWPELALYQRSKTEPRRIQIGPLDV